MLTCGSQGKWSPTTFSTSTLSTPPAKPRPPTVDPVNVGMFSVRVDWRAPDEHGSSIAAFTLRCCHDGSEHTVLPCACVTTLRAVGLFGGGLTQS